MRIRPSGKQLVLALLVVLLVASNIYQAYRLAQPPPVNAGVTAEQALDICNTLLYFNPHGIPTNTWLGITTLQNPNDAWITQEILFEIKPDFVIEAGASSGGGAAYWATILEQVNPEGKVISIDIVDEMQKARELPIVQRRVEFMIGSSTAPDIVDEIRRQVDGRSVVVILDSDHSRDHVLAEMRIYSEIVPVGSYMIVQDTNLNGNPVYPEWGPGPMEAVVDFMAENDNFVVDELRERLLFTFHPRGYLKRVK